VDIFGGLRSVLRILCGIRVKFSGQLHTRDFQNENIKHFPRKSHILFINKHPCLEMKAELELGKHCIQKYL
jgi:ABC-type transport system involved in cytochrome c biogenesis ATPase subunit